MGANNPYFPSMSKVQSLDVFTQMIVDETRTGLPLRIRIQEFFEQAISLDLLSTLSITALSDTPSALGTAGQILQMNSGADALEFVNNTFLLNSDTPNSMGTAFQVLQVNSGATALEFVDKTPTAPRVTTHSSATLVPSADYDIYLLDTSSNSIDVQLTATAENHVWQFKKISALNQVQFNPTGGDLIDGAASSGIFTVLNANIPVAYTGVTNNEFIIL